MITTNSLTIEERLEWFKNNPPETFIPSIFSTWDMVIKDIKSDIYSYAFNNPIYCGPITITDDEARHLFLDEFNIPR